MWAETEMWPRREECQGRLNPSLGDTSFSVMYNCYILIAIHSLIM